jgi:hypothetical protein
MIKKMIFSTAIYLSLVITMQQNIFAQTKTNLINNSFLSDNERKLHLIYNGALYFNSNEQGDVWSRIKDGVKSIAFDPQNDGVYYIITVDNQIQKKKVRRVIIFP